MNPAEPHCRSGGDRGLLAGQLPRLPLEEGREGVSRDPGEVRESFRYCQSGHTTVQLVTGIPLPVARGNREN